MSETEVEAPASPAEEIAAALAQPDGDPRAALAGRQAADIATALEALPTADALAALRALDTARQANVFGYLKRKAQARLGAALDRGERAAIVGAMSHDERADLYRALNEKGQEALLGVLAQAERDDLRRLAAWPEGTVGSIMTSDYAFLWPNMTAPEALEALRRQAVDSETVYTALVADGDYRLLGVLSLRDLLLAGDKARVEAIMDRDPVTVRADADREDAAQIIGRYDLLVLPVSTPKAAWSASSPRTTPSTSSRRRRPRTRSRGASVGALDADVLDTPLAILYRARVGWLVLLVFGSMFSGAGLAAFEGTIAAHMSLLFFLPLLIGSGGNAGAQSATLTVRALATGDVRPADYGRMMVREVAVAVELGLTMAFAIAIAGLLRADAPVLTVVALSMTLIVLIGSLLGLTLPFLLQRAGLDPATASGPLVDLALRRDRRPHLLRHRHPAPAGVTARLETRRRRG